MFGTGPSFHYILKYTLVKLLTVDRGRDAADYGEVCSRTRHLHALVNKS